MFKAPPSLEKARTIANAVARSDKGYHRTSKLLWATVSVSPPAPKMNRPTTARQKREKRGTVGVFDRRRSCDQSIPCKQHQRDSNYGRNAQTKHIVDEPSAKKGQKYVRIGVHMYKSVARSGVLPDVRLCSFRRTSGKIVRVMRSRSRC